MNPVKRGGKGRRPAGSKQGRAVRTSGRPIRPSFPPSLYKRFLQIAVSLEKEKVDYSLIGGFAMVLHGLPRMTRDLDSMPVTVEGRPVRVATPETLYRLKKDTLRPIDREDARFLERLIGKKGK